MMVYSEILEASCEFTWMNETQSAGEGSCIEAGIWITCASKPANLKQSKFENPNLDNLEVEDNTSANDLGRIFVSTIDTDNVKSKNQDKEDILENQKWPIFLIQTELRLQGGVESLVRRRRA